MALRVNIDALIPREDFDETAAQSRPAGSRKDKLAVNDLLKGEFFFGALRKPDFQRETSEWDPHKILNLIESFVAGDLIPAIILWQSKISNLTFVIDGSHRLSALAAWINNDYGDGDISKALYDGIIPEEQLDIAKEVRTLIDKKIGSYKDHKLAIEYPDKVRPEIASRSKLLGTLSLQLQWVEGDSKSAESSFRKINEQGVAINSTEKKILNARTKPIGFASRAVMRAGQGHNYWKAFSEDVQIQLKNTAREVNELLFRPKFSTPVKTLDLPLAGKMFSAQALPIVWDFIRIVNPLDSVDADDIDGNLTLRFLNNCRRTAQRINSKHVSSLGLHPIIYFYSDTGRLKPASLYAITSLMMEFDKVDRFIDFICIRKEFEKILTQNEYIIQQIVRKSRSAIASYVSIKDFYIACIDKLCEKKSSDAVIREIFEMKQFTFLTKAPTEFQVGEGKDFSGAVKSRAFIKAAFGGNPKMLHLWCGRPPAVFRLTTQLTKKHGGDASR